MHQGGNHKTAKQIDDEVRRLVNEAYERAKKMLTENRDKLDKIAQALVEKEVIDIDEAKILLGITTHKDPQQQVIPTPLKPSHESPQQAI